MKRGCGILLIGLLAVLVCVVVAVLGYLLYPRTSSAPLVFINTPTNGGQIAVGQETLIHASALDAERKIKRIEVWVDGTMQDAQTSAVPGGVSPFPIVVRWRPTISGTHSIVVRAFNTQNGRGNAAIDIQAVQSDDRDNDGVLDALDGCPNQPGTLANNGCLAPTSGDRDGDGISDASDTCPDQPGSMFSEGCPDADSDSVRDAVDVCPREAGSAERGGCPATGDADGDGSIDTADECPREPGPASTRGCPDSDGDAIRDRDDACPDGAGVASLAGCPDRDGDGVRDAIDLCPDVPGLPTNAGCPASGVGDRDGDGVADDTDLAPDEAASAESGGASPPGGGRDSDSDGIPDAEEIAEDPLGGFDLLVPGYFFRLTQVELQALEFQVSQDYSSVYCYASVAGRAEERIGPFASLDTRRWDIAAFLGPLNSRTFMAAAGQPIQVRVECSGIAGEVRTLPEPGGIGEGGGSEAYFDLGSFSRSHTLSDADIQEVTVDSTGGSTGHSFRIKYRICTPACKSSVFRAPLITMSHSFGQHRLAWAWAGHAYDINGFKVYMNGNYMFSVGARSTSYLFHDTPPCGRRFDIQLSAYRGNPLHPDNESPLSNTATWDGGLCPRTATVSFERFEVGDIRFAFPEFTIIDAGPLRGYLVVNDARRNFETPLRVRPNHTYYVAGLTPRTEMTVDLAPTDSLYLAALIVDRDIGRDDTLFDFESTLTPAEITTRVYRMTNRGSTLVIHITVVDR